MTDGVIIIGCVQILCMVRYRTIQDGVSYNIVSVKKCVLLQSGAFTNGWPGKRVLGKID